MLCSAVHGLWGPEAQFSQDPSLPHLQALREDQPCTTSHSPGSTCSWTNSTTAAGDSSCDGRTSESSLCQKERNPQLLGLYERLYCQLTSALPQPLGSVGTAQVRPVFPGERGVAAGPEVPTATTSGRNVLLVGCVGSGKKTLANKIAGEAVFRVLPSVEVMNRCPEVRASPYRSQSGHYFLLYDTHQTDTLRDLAEACRSDPVIRQGVHLVVFVLNDNVGANDYFRLFQEVITSLEGVRSRARVVLVVTGCEKRDDRSKYHLRHTLLHSPLTARIANFADDIVMVGFPSGLDTAAIFMDLYAAGMRDSETALRACIGRGTGLLCGIDTAFTSNPA